MQSKEPGFTDMADEIIGEPTRTPTRSGGDDRAHEWGIIATLVVPVRLDNVPWPPSEVWTIGPWPGDKQSRRPKEDQMQTYGDKALAFLLQAPDRRCHRAYAKHEEHVGKFEVECVELVKPDDRTEWGLVHLSIHTLDFKSLKARSNELYRYVRLLRASYVRQGEREAIAAITDLLSPARPDTSSGSRASAVVLLLGETVQWVEDNNPLFKALDIQPGFTFAEGTLFNPIRRAAVGLHGILLESNNENILKWHVQGVYAEQVLIARSQKEAVRGFAAMVATLFDEGAGIKADELVRDFYRWRAKLWWSDISTEATATALLQSYQEVLLLPKIVDQLSSEMADYAALAQEDAAKVAAQSSYFFALTATIFTIFAVPATVGFTGAEVLGWHGVAGFMGALGITAVGSASILSVLWRRLRHLRNGVNFRYKSLAAVDSKWLMNIFKHARSD